ncbi:MAG TPA: DegT/DnrJ/EryC1/StrS family aminotransferase [Polyangiaceae bacterium]
MTRVPLVDLAAQEGEVVEEVMAAIAEVARGAQFVLGARVEAFERWLAGECGTEHAVGVASGTDAIELALRAMGVGAGDAVVTPALSFVAAAEAIASTGARPVFCDVEAETMNASARTVDDAVRRARGAGLRVRAVVPVHLFGLCAPMNELRALAAGEELVLVEDAAQALGASDDAGRPAGGGGDAGCISFFPTKNLGAWGDGGAVVTSRDDVAARVRRLRAHGAVAAYRHAELGRNSRLDALQAAVLLVKSRHLPAWLASRARLASRYASELAGLPLVLPHVPPTPSRPAWHAYVVRSPQRDALGAFLHDAGIESRVYYPVPLHRQECFAALDEPSLPVTEDICRTALALPLFPAMTGEQHAHVIAQVRRFLA